MGRRKVEIDKNLLRDLTNKVEIMEAIA